MVDRSARLSSVLASLDELTVRLAAMADEFEQEGREDVATGLWEVERSLGAAMRRLGKVEHDLT